MKSKYAILMSIVLLLGVAHAAVAASQQSTVSQPVQLTENSYYERGQSIVYDDSEYWLFYGRSANVSATYGTGNPDVHDYAVYYKKASSIAGLASATATKLDASQNANLYLGETDAAIHDGDVWVFGACDTQDGNCDLYAWHSSYDGNTWTEEAPIVEDMSDGSAHFAAINYDGSLWVAYKSGGSWESKCYSDGNWLSKGTITENYGTGKFFVDESILYFVRADSGDQDIHKWDSSNSSWSTINSSTESGSYDPTIYKMGDNYVCAYAPWVSPKQWIKAKVGTDLSSLLSSGNEVMISAASFGENTWIDMWPIGFTDDSGNTFLFYTSERNPDDPSTEIAGNIWYLPVDWEVTNDHYTYIQNAIDEAASGDTVNVASETYTEALTITDKALTITGDSETGVIVQAADSPPAADNTFTIDAPNNDITIQNMTIRNGNYGIRSGAGDVNTGANVNVLNCTLYNNGWDGTGVDSTPTQSEMSDLWASSNTSNGGAIRIGNSTGTEIADCTVHHNLRGIRLAGGNSGNIHDCTVYDNIESGIYLSDHYGMPACYETQIHNNTVYGNMNNGILVLRGNNNSITDNTVYDNWNTGIHMHGPSDFTVEGNSVMNNSLYAFNGIGNGGNSDGGIAAAGSVSDDATSYTLIIFDNTVDNNNAGSHTDSTGLWLGPSLPGDGITVKGNTFTSHDLDIHIESQATTTVVNNNNFDGAGTGVQNDDASVTLDATYNWWGDTDPSDQVSSDVSYDPWLGYPTDQLFVNNDWSSSADGTEVESGKCFGYNAFATIQAAIDAAFAGDTINVAGETYAENVTIPTSLTLQSTSGADSTTISADGGTAVTVQANDVTIKGFTITNPNGGYGITAHDQSNLTFEENKIENIGSDSSVTDKSKGIYVKADGTSISNITINDNTFLSIGSLSGSGCNAVFIGDSTGLSTIDGVVIKNNYMDDLKANTDAYENGGRGAYGVLVNHGASGEGEVTGLEICGNIIKNAEGLWSRGIGLEGPTPNAVVSGNNISDIIDHKSLPDAVGVHFEQNPDADTVTVENNSFENVYWGVAQHADLLNNSDLTVNARP